LTAFLEFVAIVLLGVVALSAVLGWIKQAHPRWRDLAAFMVAAGAAYSGSFALDMSIGAFLGYYSFSPLTLPVFAWSGIAIALHCFARSASVRGLWIALPYLGFGGLAVSTGLLGPHKFNIAVGMPLIVFAIFSLLLGSKSAAQNGSTSASHIFPVGEYKLDAQVPNLPNLKEFTRAEYSVLGRPFEGETDYDAPPVIFLEYSWQLQLGTVKGKIYKIAPYLRFTDKQDANAVAMTILTYCTGAFGKPTDQRTGFFVWDTIDGNVILQTGEIADEFYVNLFLTSKSVRSFKRK
jgi:hypothetical protein